MDALVTLAVIAVIVVLIFDYTNGFHDASNIIATVIASRAMTPVQAVIIVAVFEFLGPLLGGTAVANTIGKFVDVGSLQSLDAVAIILCGIIGAITWNLGTWWFGIPSSSSHALVGGLVGAVVVSAGVDHVAWGFNELAQGHFTGVTKVLIALVLSPIIGFWAGFMIHRLMMFLLRAATPVANKYLRRVQFFTSAGLAFRTVPTMPRKVWASSRWCCCWAASSRNSRCHSGSSFRARPRLPWALCPVVGALSVPLGLAFTRCDHCTHLMRN